MVILYDSVDRNNKECVCLLIRFVRICSKFKSLKKTGMPQEHEWTVLAAFAVTFVSTGQQTSESASDASKDNEPIVIALGTGTKCLSHPKEPGLPATQR